MPASYIMIVDDNPANLKLLEEMLRREGHEVRSFPLGRLALTAAKKRTPDLILLDINMPEMNGYEVCEILKSDGALAGVPVIFLSALNEIEDKVRAFQAGAVDYISKPFNFEEVHARVATHLALHALRGALQLVNEHLEEAVEARTSELSIANDRLRTRTLELSMANDRLTILDSSKNDFLSLISHEFRTPLNGLLGVGELILNKIPASPENDVLIGIFTRTRRRILSILDDALLLTQIDGGDHFKSTTVSLSGVLMQAIEQTADFTKSRSVTVMPAPVDMGLVCGNQDLLVRALHALLETAVKFAAKGEILRLSGETTADLLKVIIESHGLAIPDHLLPKFFDIFSIGESITPGGDLGLGPALAYRILALFGGTVSVANLVPAGIRLTISLKDATANTHGLRAA